MLRFVTFHRLFHRRRELLVVLTLGHVDEVNANDATHVPQPQDARNFFAAFEVGLEGILLLVLGPGLPSTTVDVDDVHGFGLFDNQVRPAPQVDLLAKRGLDLAVNGQGVEQVFVPGDFDHVDFLGADALQIGFDLVAQSVVVDPNAREIRRQDIAQNRIGFVQLTQDALARLRIAELLVHDAPPRHQVFQVRVQIRRAFVLGHRTDDDAKTRRANALHQALQTFPLFLTLDASR